MWCCFDVIGLARKPFALAFFCLVPVAAQALNLSFDEAQERLLSVSDALASSRSQLEQKHNLEVASHANMYPDISLDAKLMRFSKASTLEPNPLLGNPVAVELNETDWRTRPIVTAIQPLWTGGKILAAKQAAKAAQDEAAAELQQTQQSELVQLAQAYFGQQFAEQVLRVRHDVRNGLSEHYQRATRLEQEGFATKAQKLQAQVALDNAEREYRKAQNDLLGAQAALSGLLRSDVVRPTTALFMLKTPIPNVDTFLQAALAEHPGLMQIRAIARQVEQKVKAEQAAYLPHFYLFGQYDFNQKDALLTDSDWAFGVGMSYSLFSNQNRSRQVGAAKSQQRQVQYQLQDTSVKLAIAVQRAWYALDSAQQQFALLQSALASADENLRLQSLSFQAGQATSLDVIDARLQQGKVRIERAQAAWQFDLALMQLLDVSGQTQQFTNYLTQAEWLE